MKMKQLLLLISGLLLSEFQSSAQHLYVPENEYKLTNDCGTWQKKPIYYTEWETEDSLKTGIKNSKRDWVYSDYKYVSNLITTLEYCPCGCGKSEKWTQERVCRITGILQIRYKIQGYQYIPNPKNYYDKVVDSLKAN